MTFSVCSAKILPHMTVAESRLSPDMPIEYLRLPERAYNALITAGVLTIRDVLLEIHQGTLTAIKGVGVKMASEVIKIMSQKGFEKNVHLVKTTLK